MAWRGAQATSQNPHVEPQAPAAVTQPAIPAPTPPSTPPSTSKTDPSEGTPPANEQATAPSDSGRAQVESGQVESTVKASSDKSAHATPPAARVVETKPSEVSVAATAPKNSPSPNVIWTGVTVCSEQRGSRKMAVEIHGQEQCQCDSSPGGSVSEGGRSFEELRSSAGVAGFRSAQRNETSRRAAATSTGLWLRVMRRACTKRVPFLGAIASRNSAQVRVFAEIYWVASTDGIRRDSYHSASSTRFQSPSLS